MILWENVMTPHCCLALKSKVELNKTRLVDFRKSIGRPYNAQSGDGDLPDDQNKTLKALEQNFDEVREELTLHLRMAHGT
jgi:hypothetical protein